MPWHARLCHSPLERFSRADEWRRAGRLPGQQQQFQPAKPASFQHKPASQPSQPAAAWHGYAMLPAVMPWLLFTVSWQQAGRLFVMPGCSLHWSLPVFRLCGNGANNKWGRDGHGKGNVTACSCCQLPLFHVLRGGAPPALAAAFVAFSAFAFDVYVARVRAILQTHVNIHHTPSGCHAIVIISSFPSLYHLHFTTAYHFLFLPFPNYH